MVRVNDDEHREFTKFAEAIRHTTVSELMRQLFHREMEAARKVEAA